MGKGGGSSDEQTIITELPEYARPYFMRMMERAEDESRVPYLRYEGPRQAALTPTTGHGIDIIRGMAGLEAIPRSDEPYVDIPYQDIPEEYLAPPSADPEQDDRIRALEAQLAELSKPPPRERRREGGGDAGSGTGYRDGGIIDLVRQGSRYVMPGYQEGGVIDYEAAVEQMREANARRSHYQAAGEAALETPVGERDKYDWQAIDNFIAFFGTPSDAWEKAEQQLMKHQGPSKYRDGGAVSLFQEGGEVVQPTLPEEVDQAAAAAQQAAGYQAGDITATYADQLAQSRQFDEAAAQQYMNPYITNVLDRLQERNIERYQRQARDIGAQAAAAGAFGGSRAYLASQQAREDLAQQQADTEAQQMAEAYRQAGQLFTADEARRLQGLTTAGQQDLTAQQAAEQARYGAAQTQLGAAGQLAGIGQLRQGLGLQQADALIKAGQLEQQERQRTADLAFEEFLRERGYEKEQIGFLSSILRGVPVQPNQTQTFPAAGPGGLAQGLGLGIAGLGLAQQLGAFDTA
jgi:hypothetical protein